VQYQLAQDQLPGGQHLRALHWVSVRKTSKTYRKSFKARSEKSNSISVRRNSALKIWKRIISNVSPAQCAT